jgi:hypothetical protein
MLVRCFCYDNTQPYPNRGIVLMLETPGRCGSAGGDLNVLKLLHDTCYV